MVVGVAGGCSEGGSIFGPAPVPYEQRAWDFGQVQGVELTTQHYVLRTTFKHDEFVRAIPAFQEACWKAYSELLPSPNAPAEPMPTYLFRERWQWERFTENFTPARAPTYKKIRYGGYTERGVTVSHYSGRKNTLAVLAHEGLHQYLDVTHGKPIPAWLNEGLACYFEGYELDAHNRPIFTPDQNAQRANQLRESLTAGKMIPLREILGTHAGVEVHKASKHVRTYYAQMWGMMVFLLDSPVKNPYHDVFRKLLADLGSDTMTRRAQAYLAADTDGKWSYGEAVFRAYITEDLERFEADFDKYIRALLGLRS